MMMVTLLVAAGTVATTATADGAACKTELDCQLNGLCTAGKCVCDPAWKGGNCSTLNLLPAKMQNGYGSLGSNTSSWGGGVLQDPKSGKWFMFVSEMNMGCGLGTWGGNSRCVLAESATPNGPFSFVQVVVDSWCHGATPGRDPFSGKWLFNHMGNGQAKGGSCTLCNNGTTPRGAKKGPCTTGGAGTVDTGAALTADAPTGPYTAQPHMTNGANCEPFFHPDGTLFMACPSGGGTTAPNCNKKNAFLTMSKAPSIEAAMAGHYEDMPVRTRLAGTDDRYHSPASICFNWEVCRSIASGMLQCE